MQEKITADEVELLGVDALQFIGNLNVISCLNGSAFQLSDGLVPYGNVDAFLTPKQIAVKYRSKDNSRMKVNHAIVNFVMNPIGTTFDPIGPVAKDSLIDERLDRMFKVDSLGFF